MSRTMYECFGCKRELCEETDGIYPQGTKNDPRKWKLCKTCNKKFPEFQSKSKAIYDAIDYTRDKQVEKVRLEVFQPEKVKEQELKDEMPIRGAEVERK